MPGVEQVPDGCFLNEWGHQKSHQCLLPLFLSFNVTIQGEWASLRNFHKHVIILCSNSSAPLLLSPDILLIFYLCACVCVYHMFTGVCGSQKKASDPSELELQVVEATRHGC